MTKAGHHEQSRRPTNTSLLETNASRLASLGRRVLDAGGHGDLCDDRESGMVASRVATAAGSRQRSLDFLRTHPVENAPIPSETNPFSVKNESILDEKPLKKGSIWVRFPKRTHRISSRISAASSLCSACSVINTDAKRWVRFAETHVFASASSPQ
jgi:hypothetical protein